jgi:hypothetical protein
MERSFISGRRESLVRIVLTLLLRLNDRAKAGLVFGAAQND